MARRGLTNRVCAALAMLACSLQLAWSSAASATSVVQVHFEDLAAQAEVIFEGSPLDAVPAFPKNINVAAALSLAGVGAERTLVRIVVDPDAERNCHQIEMEGEFGRLTTKTENLPAPFNPRTSYLAALSAVACLQKITGTLKVGG